MDNTRTKQGIERKDDPVWEEKTPSGAVKRKGGSNAWDDDDYPKLVRTNANVPLGDSFGVGGMSGMNNTTSSASATTSVNMSVPSTNTATNVTTANAMAATGVTVGESAKETPPAKPAKEKVKSAKFTSIRTTITDEEMTTNGVPRENPFLVDAPKTNKVVKVRKKE